MSHNKITVKGKTPDGAGEIAIGLNDLLAGTPSAGEVVVYSGGTWSPGTASVSSEHIFIGEGASVSIPVGVATGAVTAGVQWVIYDSAPANTITGATINYHTGTNWVDSVSLPAGTYLIQAQTGAEFTSSGYFALAVKSGATYITSLGVIGEDLATYGGFDSTAVGHVIAGGSVTLKLFLNTGSNIDTFANQGNTPAENGFWWIERLV